MAARRTVPATALVPGVFKVHGGRGAAVRLGVTATLRLLGALLAAAASCAPATTAFAARGPAVSASAAEGLSSAIERFAAVDPDLFAANEPARAGRRWIRPALRPVRYRHEELGVSATTSVDGGVSPMEVSLYNQSGGLDITTSGPRWEVSLPSELASTASHLQGLAGIAGAAFVVAGVQRETDMLIRPLPLGVSVYALLRSARAPERIEVGTNLDCPTTGSDLFRRLGPGSFSYEEMTVEDVEDECGAYSHVPVGHSQPPPASSTAAAYRAERKLLASARTRARQDRAVTECVITAYPARDADGHTVPTEMAWRSEDGPVVRVRLGAAHPRFPVIERFDVIAAR